MRLQPHPFRQLLYVEWVLLGITVLTLVDFIFLDVFVDRIPQPPTPIPSLVAIAIFGVMGLRLPIDGSRIVKIVYTGIEFGLIEWAATTYDWTIADFLLSIVVIRSSLMFDRSGRWAIAAATFVWFLIGQSIDLTDKIVWQLDPDGKWVIKASPDLTSLPPPESRELLWQYLFQEPLWFGLILVFVLLIVNALIDQRNSRQKLAVAHEQLRTYALRIEDQATLQERNRIAREIHDSLGHLLTAQSIQLENALLFFSSDTEKSHRFLQESKKLGSNALKELRRSLVLLRSDPLQGQSLEVAIERLVANFSQTTGTIPECQIDLDLPLPGEIRTAIYRIVQEALTNITKHSDATQVSIQLQIQSTQYDAAYCQIQVSDNGRGFNVEDNFAGFGLQGMRERVMNLGGQLRIDSQPGSGCLIWGTFPLPRILILE